MQTPGVVSCVHNVQDGSGNEGGGGSQRKNVFWCNSLVQKQRKPFQNKSCSQRQGLEKDSKQKGSFPITHVSSHLVCIFRSCVSCQGFEILLICNQSSKIRLSCQRARARRQGFIPPLFPLVSADQVQRALLGCVGSLWQHPLHHLKGGNSTFCLSCQLWSFLLCSNTRDDRSQPQSRRKAREARGAVHELVRPRLSDELDIKAG